MNEDIAAVLRGEREYAVMQGDCQDILPSIPAGTVDVVLTDPPYPCIDRPYGYWSEDEWFELMHQVVPLCMASLKPTGSAVFILQPNSEYVGRMRTWLWEFMTWVGRQWGIVQDAWWWNVTTIPTVHCSSDFGLMRPSLKACVWVGPADCYRCQEAILWSQGRISRAAALTDRALQKTVGGMTRRDGRLYATALERGGSTPFNVLPWGANGRNEEKNGNHGAGTPLEVCHWWVKYLCPPGGTVLDPFAGVSTVGLAALKFGCRFIGIEAQADYCAIARRRLEAAEADQRDSLFPAREPDPQQKTFADLLDAPTEGD